MKLLCFYLFSNELRALKTETISTGLAWIVKGSIATRTSLNLEHAGLRVL